MSLVLHEQHDLTALNSFGFRLHAALYAEAANAEEVREAQAVAAARGLPLLLLGGGSNLLLCGDPQALVLRMTGHGVRLLAEDDGRLLVEAEAGEAWHPFVRHCLEQGWYGLENLSLIPGTVGAAPMQNIGAYGVELADRFAGLDALDLHTGEERRFSLEDCAFGYRDSRFKREAGRWAILRVRFALTRQAQSRLDYAPLAQFFAEAGIAAPTPIQVSEAVCAIRRDKLPDPARLGNAGSFFKNPTLSAAEAERLCAAQPRLPAYPQADGSVKVAAGWLIEQAGWKGFREGDAGVHERQALVLVNHGLASGAQVLALAQRIQADIHARYGVTLEIEPNVL